MGYLDGSLPCPPEFIEDPRTLTLIANPTNKLWLRQDRLLLHTLQTSVSANISTLVSRCNTAAEAWSKLETTYASRSNSRMLSLRDTLMKFNKEGKTVAEYMHGIKTSIDDLDLIGHPLNDGEIVVHTLNDLGYEYKELGEAIRACDSPISFEELHEKLLDHEPNQKREEANKGILPITAHFNQKGSHSHHFHKGYRNNPTNSFGKRQMNGNFESFHHKSYNTRQPHRSPQFGNGPSRIVCQLCDKAGHSAKVCRSRGVMHQLGLKANYMSSDRTGNWGDWVVDSGASHHITSDLQNLSIHSEYGGNEDIMVGDGKAIAITHVGSTSLHSPTSPPFNLMMFCVHLILNKTSSQYLNFAPKIRHLLNSFLISFL